MKKMISAVVAASIVAGFVLGVVVPIGVYIGNAADFPQMTVGYMFQICGFTWVGFALIFFFSFVIAGLLHRKFLCVWMAIVSALILMLYVQGNFINIKYPVLDGKEIPWGTMHVQGVINTAIWIVIGLGVAFASFRALMRDKGWYVLCVWVFGSYCALVCGMRVVSLNVENAEEKKPVQFTTKGFFHVAEERNLIVFIVDTLDKNLMDKVLRANPEVKDWFSDFAWYRNTIGRFPTTKGAVPHIITGVANDNSRPFSAYKDYAYTHSVFLNRAAQLGFDINIYVHSVFAPSVDAATELPKLCNVSWKKPPFSEHYNDFAEIYDGAVFSYLPHYLKRFYMQLSWPRMEVQNGLVVGGENPSVGNSDRIEADLFDFEKRCGRLELQSGKNFKIYHLRGVHVPDYTIDKAMACLSAIAAYVKELKRLGVYDRTSVIILADHGYITNENPLFMCNHQGENFKIVKKPFSYDGLSSVFNQGLEKSTVEVPRFPGARQFTYYSWDGSWSSRYLPKLENRQYDARGRRLKADAAKSNKEDGISFSDVFEVENISADRWTLSTNSSFCLPLDREKGQVLVMTLRMLLGGKHLRRSATICIDGGEEMRVAFDEIAHSTKVVRIPIQKDKKDDYLMVCIKADSIVPVKEISPKSADTRSLGVRIEDVSYAER